MPSQHAFWRIRKRNKHKDKNMPRELQIISCSNLQQFTHNDLKILQSANSQVSAAMVQIRKMRNAVRAEEPFRMVIWDIKFTSSSLQLSNEGDFILPHGAQFLRL